MESFSSLNDIYRYILKNIGVNTNFVKQLSYTKDDAPNEFSIIVCKNNHTFVFTQLFLHNTLTHTRCFQL